MSSSKFIEVCRICLGDKELFDWNKEIFDFCGLTYKDCYYKYIQLDENCKKIKDSNLYPNHLCGMCGNELKNAHFLFERALESFCILRNCINSKNLITDYSDVEICSVPTSRIKSENYLSQSLDQTDNESQTNELSCDSDNIAETETRLGDYEEVLISNFEGTDPGLCEEVHKIESSAEAILEPQFCEISVTDLNSFSLSSMEEKIDDNNSLATDVDDDYENLQKSGNSEQTTTNQQTTSDQNNECEQNVHQSAENPTEKPRRKYIFLCQYCSLKINGIAQLKKHEATHRENRERTHVCTKCGLKLYTKCGLTEHMKIHEENRQKNHKCEFCDKAFYNKGALNIHRRIHLGLMLKCQLCPKEYYRQIDLDRHLASHSASPLRKVVKKKFIAQCQYCDKTIRIQHLRAHIAAHENQPQVKCKICDKKFFARSACAKHLRRSHHKTKDEYAEFIHYLPNCNNRMSHLRMEQIANIQVITE